jgi:hypothetical protein
MLLFLNSWQLASIRFQRAAAGPGEFTKPIYEPKFTKMAEGMSFVNPEPDASTRRSKQDFRGSGEVQLLPPSSGIYPLT